MAKHAKFMSDNTYFMGMRVSVLNANQKVPVDIRMTDVFEAVRTSSNHKIGNLDQDHLNETDYGDTDVTKWRTEAGKFGAGFVWFLPSNMSRVESVEEL